MSVFYGVRLTDESSEKIVATGRGKSEVIQAAVNAYFSLVPVVVEKARNPAVVNREPEEIEKFEAVADRISQEVDEINKAVEPDPVAVEPASLDAMLAAAASGEDAVEVVVPVVVPEIKEPKAKKSAACPECFSLSGHQKFCTRKGKK